MKNLVIQTDGKSNNTDKDTIIYIGKGFIKNQLIISALNVTNVYDFKMLCNIPTV